MHTVRKSVTLLFFVTAFLSSSVGYAGSVSPETENAGHEQHSMDWPGIYFGMLPCADCYGVKTSLALNKNNTYILMTQMTGKSPREFTEKGKFTWGTKKDTIILTSRDGSVTHHYAISENALTQLDNHGEPISGKDAERYILHRTDVTKSTKEHAGH